MYRNIVRAFLVVCLIAIIAMAACASYSHLTSGPKLSGAGWTVQIQNTGAIAGTVEFINTASGDSYLWASAYSHSSGSPSYYHYWTWKSVSDGNWVTTVTSASNLITVTGVCPDFTVVRNMSWNGAKFTMTDQLSNNCATPILVATNYWAVMENLVTSNNSAIGGVPFDYNNETYTGLNMGVGPNPTIWMQQANSWLAWLCDDDIYRNQMYLMQSTDQSSSVYNQTIVQDYNFGLPAKGQYTYNYYWYPGAASQDYWSFINWVRNDWGMNWTCHGPYVWDQHVDQGGRNFNRIVLCPWFRDQDGTGIPDSTYDSIQSGAVSMAMTTCNGGSAMGTTAPCFMCKIETNDVPIDWTTITNGSTLVGGGYPTSSNWYTDEPLTATQTSTLNNGSTDANQWKYSVLFQDSGRTQEVVSTSYEFMNGTQWSTYCSDTNPGHWLSLTPYPAATPTAWANPTKGENWRNYVYPTDWNFHMQYMRGQIDHLLTSTLNTVPTSCTKGLFLDSYDLGWEFKNPDGNDPNFSWNTLWDEGQWDGFSVLNNGALIGNYMTSALIMSIPGRAALLNYITNGYVMSVVTNGHTVDSECRGINNKQYYENFAETESDAIPDMTHMLLLMSGGEPWASQAMCTGHLSTPLSDGVEYGNWNTQTGYPNWGNNNIAAIQNKYEIMCLRNGTMMEPYSNYVPSSGAGSGGYGIINIQYPFTPVELHSGYLIGQEKILTAVSGTWYWSKSVHSAQPATCKVFDSCGNAIAYKTFTVSDTGTGTWKVVLSLPNDWNNTCAIW
jgi:hypothetical protein